MTLISLLLSRDQQVIGVVRTALEKLAVEVAGAPAPAVKSFPLKSLTL
jgi:hypothetical protein